MENLDIIQILKLGLPGLVFLLMLMSFRLISKQQEINKPDPEMHRTIRKFAYINVLLAVLTVSAPILEHFYINVDGNSGDDHVSDTFKINAYKYTGTLSQGEAVVCTNSPYKGRYLLLKDTEINSGAIIQVRSKASEPCINGEEQLRVSEDDAVQLGWENKTQGTLLVDVALDGYKFDI